MLGADINRHVGTVRLQRLSAAGSTSLIQGWNPVSVLTLIWVGERDYKTSIGDHGKAAKAGVSEGYFVLRVEPMPQIEIYKNIEGDSWFLCRNEMGHVYVVQEPTESSGRKGSVVGLGEFLSKETVGPEHDALLRLIGSLVDRTSAG
jgi:hypothetical protein